MAVRPQYHFRRTASGLNAWDVRRLIELSAHLPVIEIDPTTIKELDENHWGDATPTPMSIIKHMKLIESADLGYPIILDANGRVMDGMHRICKAVLADIPVIKAVQFVRDPEPDYVDCHPDELPYDS